MAVSQIPDNPLHLITNATSTGAEVQSSYPIGVSVQQTGSGTTPPGRYGLLITFNMNAGRCQQYNIGYDKSVYVRVWDNTAWTAWEKLDNGAVLGTATINSDAATVFQGLSYAQCGRVVTNGAGAYFGFTTTSNLATDNTTPNIVTGLPVPIGETSCIARNTSTKATYVLRIHNSNGTGAIKNSTIDVLPAGRYTVQFSYICV